MRMTSQPDWQAMAHNCRDFQHPNMRSTELQGHLPHGECASTVADRDRVTRGN